MIGSDHLTDISKQQAETAPGMAYFAGTGPAGKTCGDCCFKGYTYNGRERINPRTGNHYTPQHRSNGCAKAYELRGKDKTTPDIGDKLKACKYFLQKMA